MKKKTLDQIQNLKHMNHPLFEFLCNHDIHIITVAQKLTEVLHLKSQK